MNTLENVIAIDGPAGCGKSTVTKIIAKLNNLNYIDTGALFRVIAYGLLKNNDPSKLDDPTWLATEIGKLKIKYKYANERLSLILNGEEVSDQIRAHSVSSLASMASQKLVVRKRVEELEREIANSSDSISILEGRDIGTVIFPHAKLKIFLIASSIERAKRRFEQLKIADKLDGLTLEKIKADIDHRDKEDSQREIAPLKKAEDAIEIDTTHSSIEEVVEKINILVKSRFKC